MSLVWVINTRKKKIFPNPVKLVEEGLLQSKCGHAKKLVDNDLIFPSLYEATKYMDLMEPESIFNESTFGVEKRRFLKVKYTDGKGKTKESSLTTRVILEEQIGFNVGDYFQYVTLIFDEHKYNSKFLSQAKDISIEFKYGGKQQIIDNLKFVACSNNKIKLYRIRRIPKSSY